MAYRKRGTESGLRHRVVITGAGIVTSLGWGWEINAAGFREGRAGLRAISVFDTSRQRVQRGGEVEMNAAIPPCGLTIRQIARLDRATTMLVHAGLEALKTAGWTREMRVEEPVPVALGTSAGAMSLGEQYFKLRTTQPGSLRHAATLSLLYQPNSQAQLLADAVGITGPVTIITNACASGANSIGHAFRLVKHGHARRVIAGGYDALAQLVFAGFDSLQALSMTGPRPFAADRDGLALGEGAAVLTLERLDDAIERGAPILGEVAGYGASTDLHHLTQPHPDGDAALRSMRAACDEARVTPDEVGYVNAHGTGTVMNDGSEARAICRWAGDHAGSVRVSSTKGSIGHLLGGAGSVEAVICLMALQGGWLPPNVPVDQIDPACAFDLVQAPRDVRLDCALTNSFGFGGANASLVLKKMA